MAFVRSLALALALLAISFAISPAAARELSQLDACAGSVPPDGVFQITARGTFECGRSDGNTTPGGQKYIVYYGGTEKQCSAVAPWNQPQVRGYPQFSISKRSYWRLNTNTDGTGTVSTYSRDCPNGKQSFLTVNSAGEPVLSAKPGVWRFVRTKATGALLCDDYSLVFVRSGEALSITGELSCEAPRGNGLVMATQSGALDQQLVINVVFGKPAPGI